MEWSNHEIASSPPVFSTNQGCSMPQGDKELPHPAISLCRPSGCTTTQAATSLSQHQNPSQKSRPCECRFQPSISRPLPRLTNAHITDVPAQLPEHIFLASYHTHAGILAYPSFAAFRHLVLPAAEVRWVQTRDHVALYAFACASCA